MSFQNPNLPQPHPNEFQQQHEDNARRHNRLGMAVLAGATGAGLLVGATHGAIEHHSATHAIEASEGSIHKYVHEEDAKVSADATDPRFRATAISLLNKGFKTGSASLIRTPAGTIQLITVEHVARPYANMPDAVHEQGAHIGGSDKGPNPESDNRAFIPGLGLLKRHGKPTFFETSGVASKGEEVDLFAALPLSEQQQAALEKAEKQGVIAIPEQSTAKPTLGDILYVPSAQDGKQIPLMYINNRGENGDGITLLPLQILDPDLDVQKGRDNFYAAIEAERQATATRKAEALANGISFGDATEDYFIMSAAAALSKEFEENYGYSSTDNKANAEELSKNLPCHGDSGAPLMDSSGNTLGVLSSGDGFVDPYAFMRDGFANMTCLSSITFDRLPDNFGK